MNKYLSGIIALAITIIIGIVVSNYVNGTDSRCELNKAQKELRVFRMYHYGHE